MTGGGDFTTGFLVEVARKRGRLSRGGVPNLHSAALTVLSDVNDERLVLPSPASSTVSGNAPLAKSEVQVVSQLAEPFRIEGLWHDEAVGGVLVE